MKKIIALNNLKKENIVKYLLNNYKDRVFLVSTKDMDINKSVLANNVVLDIFKIDTLSKEAFANEKILQNDYYLFA